jgi:hypothetical protein
MVIYPFVCSLFHAILFSLYSGFILGFGFIFGFEFIFGFYIRAGVGL